MDDEARAALRRFVEGDYARVVGAVTVICGDAHRAADAVQDALVRLIEHRGEVQNPAGWVTTVALNLERSRLRRAAAEVRALRRSAPERPTLYSSEDVSGDGLRTVLAGLSRRQREVVVLHYLLDWSVAEVAAALGVSDGTVKTQLSRARDQLRVALADDLAASTEEVSDG